MALLNNENTNVDNLPLILSLDVAGQPHRWITYQDACYYTAKGSVAWAVDDSEITIYGGWHENEQSSLTFNTIIAIRGQALAKSSTRHTLTPTLTNVAMFRRDRNTCAYCGRKFTTSKLTRDHIKPQSRGGQNTWTNCVTSCGPCNRRKDDSLLSECGMELLYVPYNPCRSEYLILMNRKILSDQMDFLLKNIKNKHSRIVS